MKCPDCEQEVDKLTSQGMCRLCYKRLYSFRGRGKEYIPLKDVKGTSEYAKAMGRRENAKAKRALKEEKEEVVVVKDDHKKVEDPKLKYYTKVTKDIKEQFDKNGIDESFLNVDLSGWMETFWTMLQDNSFITDAIKANKIFDDLSYLYLHAQAKIDWSDHEKILENSLYEKAVLELRRPTKDFVIFWKAISDVINMIRSNDVLMEEIRSARIDLKRTVEKFREPVYLTEIDNTLSDVDGVKIVNKTYKYFAIKVTVKGLYGHNYNETFKLDTPMYAKDEEEARTKFIEFMTEKFPTVKYRPENIKLEELK